MSIIWEAMAAMSAILIIIGSLIAIFVRLSVDSALSRFKSELIETLDGRYVLRVEYNATQRKEAS